MNKNEWITMTNKMFNELGDAQKIYGLLGANCRSTVQGWKKRGIPAEKVIKHIDLIGRFFNIQRIEK